MPLLSQSSTNKDAYLCLQYTTYYQQQAAAAVTAVTTSTTYQQQTTPQQTAAASFQTISDTLDKLEGKFDSFNEDSFYISCCFIFLLSIQTLTNSFFNFCSKKLVITVSLYV